MNTFKDNTFEDINEPFKDILIRTPHLRQQGVIYIVLVSDFMAIALVASTSRRTSQSGFGNLIVPEV